ILRRSARTTSGAVPADRESERRGARGVSQERGDLPQHRRWPDGPAAREVAERQALLIVRDHGIRDQRTARPPRGPPRYGRAHLVGQARTGAAPGGRHTALTAIAVSHSAIAVTLPKMVYSIRGTFRTAPMSVEECPPCLRRTFRRPNTAS